MFHLCPYCVESDNGKSPATGILYNTLQQRDNRRFDMIRQTIQDVYIIVFYGCEVEKLYKSKSSLREFVKKKDIPMTNLLPRDAFLGMYFIIKLFMHNNLKIN